MNIFFQELEQQYRQQPIILVMDGASWHKSRSLNLPENVEIIYLPPYSPELNPVERL
jgi:transposase